MFSAPSALPGNSSVEKCLVTDRSETPKAGPHGLNDLLTGTIPTSHEPIGLWYGLLTADDQPRMPIGSPLGAPRSRVRQESPALPMVFAGSKQPLVEP